MTANFKNVLFKQCVMIEVEYAALFFFILRECFVTNKKVCVCVCMEEKDRWFKLDLITAPLTKLLWEYSYNIHTKLFTESWNGFIDQPCPVPNALDNSECLDILRWVLCDNFMVEFSLRSFLLTSMFTLLFCCYLMDKTHKWNDCT